MKLCTFYMHSLYCDLLRLTMGKGSCRAVSFPVWICWWIIDILSFSWLILSHMCVPLCFFNIPILGTICLHLVHKIFLRSECFNKQTKNRCYPLSGTLFVFQMFLVFLILWKHSLYLFQSCLEHHYFSFLRWKLLKYPSMLDVVVQKEFREVF